MAHLAAGYIQLVHGSGHSHIEKPPLLLYVGRIIFQCPCMRYYSILASGQEYHLELQSFGGVYGHKPNLASL
jgi:hypothetical protein